MARLCAPFPPIRERLDADIVSAIQKVQQIALTMKDSDGVTRPHHLPTPLALAIVRALRGERSQAAADNADRMPVPER